MTPTSGWSAASDQQIVEVMESLTELLAEPHGRYQFAAVDLANSRPSGAVREAEARLLTELVVGLRTGQRLYESLLRLGPMRQLVFDTLKHPDVKVSLVGDAFLAAPKGLDLDLAIGALLAIGWQSTDGVSLFDRFVDGSEFSLLARRMNFRDSTFVQLAGVLMFQGGRYLCEMVQKAPRDRVLCLTSSPQGKVCRDALLSSSSGYSIKRMSEGRFGGVLEGETSEDQVAIVVVAVLFCAAVIHMCLPAVVGVLDAALEIAYGDGKGPVLISDSDSAQTSDDPHAITGAGFEQLLPIGDWRDDAVPLRRPTAELVREAHPVSIADLHLESVDRPSSDALSDLARYAEPLIKRIDNSLNEGAWADVQYVEDQVRRDLGYVRGELFETEPADWVGPVVGAVVARLERNLLAVTSGLSDANRSLALELIDAVGSDELSKVTAAVDQLIENINWLAAENDFSQFYGDDSLGRIDPGRFVAASLHWGFDTPKDAVSAAGSFSTVGGAAGTGIGFIVGALTKYSVLGSMTAMGPAGLVLGAIVGVSLAYLAARWRVVREYEQLGRSRT
jgi:hypothetical protein